MKVSPAKARKLESVMRGMSHHGITQIGFGNNAPTVDVNDLYPMVCSLIYLLHLDHINPICIKSGNLKISTRGEGH